MKKLIVLLSVVLLPGCSLMSPVKVKPVARYALQSAPVTPASSRTRSYRTLLVNDIVSNPGYASSQMVYVNVPYKLKSFADNAWVAPPASMLLPMLEQQIRLQRYFKAVVATPFSGSTNYVLSSRLVMLQQEFLQPTSQVRMAMRVSLISTRTNKVMAEKLFVATVPAPNNNPYSGVLAANRAANDICKQIARFVVKAVRVR